jgi:hypothetical protein
VPLLLLLLFIDCTRALAAIWRAENGVRMAVGARLAAGGIPERALMLLAGAHFPQL